MKKHILEPARFIFGLKIGCTDPFSNDIGFGIAFEIMVCFRFDTDTDETRRFSLPLQILILPQNYIIANCYIKDIGGFS
jgi:hypothetical protein